MCKKSLSYLFIDKYTHHSRTKSIPIIYLSIISWTKTSWCLSALVQSSLAIPDERCDGHTSQLGYSRIKHSVSSLPHTRLDKPCYKNYGKATSQKKLNKTFLWQTKLKNIFIAFIISAKENLAYSCFLRDITLSH